MLPSRVNRNPIKRPNPISHFNRFEKKVVAFLKNDFKPISPEKKMMK
jgi:hypothetical protein